MKVWPVLETADYQTVAIFATEELAQAYVDRDRARRMRLYGERLPHLAAEVVLYVDEAEVLTELPPDDHLPGARMR